MTQGEVVKLDAGNDGSLTLDGRSFVEGAGSLDGGDASSDSYCYS